MDAEFLRARHQYAISLPGAIVFFVGFFEGAPAFRRGLLPLAVAWGCMGFGLLWVMQIHMSWVVLPVYVLAAAVGLLTKNDSGNRFREPIPGVVFSAGAAIPGCLLLPTLTRYGIRAVGLTGALAFQWQSPFGFLSTAARVCHLRRSNCGASLASHGRIG